MVKIEREIIGFKHQNISDMHKQPEMPCLPQDDFFIIGPSDTRLAPSIAYPNRLKYFSRSTSPGPVRFRQDQKRAVKNNTKEARRKQKSMAISHSNRTRPLSIHDAMPPAPKAMDTTNEEVSQTDAPRKALEAEIQRIRSDLERRKHRLRESHVRPQKNKENETGKPPTQLMEPVSAKRVEVAPPTDKATETPFAPRGDAQHPRFTKIQPERRRRSASPIARSHQTEYQRAYRALEMLRPNKPALPKGTPVIARRQTESNIPVKYESEYQREYKPFKYVSVEKLKTTSLEGHKGEHIVPIPRPRSATNPSVTEPNRNILEAHRNLRSLTPPADGEQLGQSRKRRYKTEYVAKYKNFSLPHSRDNSPSHAFVKTTLMKWYQEWGRTRQQAGRYRERDRGSHFTPYHLGQLDSAWVDCWDPPSTPSHENREKMRAQLARPAAGKPSLLNGDCQPKSGSWTINARREAMYDSHHVAEVLEAQEPWDDSSSESDTVHNPISNSQQTGPNQSNLTREAEQQNHPKNERLSSMFPQGQIIRGLRSNSPEKQIHSMLRNPVFATNSSSLDGDIYSESTTDENGYCVHATNQGIDECANRHLIPTTMDTDPIVSSSTPSPLSVRSMLSSASMASETLERAKRRRDQMLRDYDSGVQHKYSPSAYNDPLYQSEN